MYGPAIQHTANYIFKCIFDNKTDTSARTEEQCIVQYMNYVQQNDQLLLTITLYSKFATTPNKKSYRMWQSLKNYE